MKTPGATAERSAETDLLRGEEHTGFARWDLPSFDAEPHQVPLDKAKPGTTDKSKAAQPVEELELVESPKPFTVEELEQIRDEAYKEGFAAGEKDGYQAGQAKAQQAGKSALDARLGQLEKLMQQLLEPMHEQDEQIELMLLNLVETMARQVIQRELKLDSGQILAVLRGALKALPMGAENIRIYLNPVDFEAAKALRERHEENWRLLEDEQLMPGGCRIETEHSQLDATLETRLQQITEQLFEQQRELQARPPQADISLQPDADNEV
ncbi:MAG: flagellar assembly protein FliH [Gammaproteobacteria bacterium HGW-Gammaproteobacteria-11]|nr:MAG: flagellar assembly protein FliH [Gammaproteobacteria bacterium HGW-Gammaproteobacteria-11]